jgi:hypothetical protein
MISLKACSTQVQDLPWSEMLESVARASKVVVANHAHFCAHFLHTTRKNFCGRAIPRVCESTST